MLISNISLFIHYTSLFLSVCSQDKYRMTLLRGLNVNVKYTEPYLRGATDSCYPRRQILRGRLIFKI